MNKPILLQDLGYLYAKESSKQKAHFGLFECGYCGKEFTTRISSLKIGLAKNCGCYTKQKRIIANTKHGMSNTNFYKIWTGMIQRCTNINNNHYAQYGNRGIIVCKEWLIFENFYNDMFQDYQKGLSIDRINNDKGYSKDNCRWTIKKVQARNTRKIMSTNSSGYRGVSIYSQSNKWRATIRVNGILISLGLFEKSIDAAKAYDEYVIANNLEHTINNV